jgi:O-antigen/teichoic acid export membrane protein
VTPEDEDSGELKGLVVRGVGWNVAWQGLTQVLGMLTAIVVARYLGPREVGLAAEALVFGSLALVIVDFGFGAAVVQRPALSEEDKSTAFWAGIVLGVALTLIGIGLSWPIASVYGEPEVQPLFAALSFAFLFTAPSIVQGALLVRELRFRTLGIRAIIATTVSCVTGMTLAVLGAGAWAIVVQDLVIAGLGMALLWHASDWRPRAVFSVASLKSMSSYTGHIFGTNLVSWGTLNVDNFLVGRFLGAAPLGAYSIAFSVMIAPVNRVAMPVVQVFFPAFSKMRDRERIGQTWLRAIRMVALVITPMMLGLVVVAPDFVLALFGEKWHEAIPVIQILAPVGLIQGLTALNEGILKALAHTRILFRFTAALSAMTIGAFAVGLVWGLEGVAAAYLVVTLVMQPIYLRLTVGVVGVPLSKWVKSVSGVIQAGAGMALVVLGARALLGGMDLQAGSQLAVLVAVGAVAYIPLVWWRAPEARDELRRLLRNRRTPDQGVAKSVGAEV